jgi:ATP-dependent Lhr-like helicase
VARLQSAHRQQYRLNIGTIVEEPMLKVRLAMRGQESATTGPISAAGRVLGEIEEYFFNAQAGRHVPLRRQGRALRRHPRERGLRLRASGEDAKMPSYAGGKFPLSTYLADQVRAMLADPDEWHAARAGGGLAAHPGDKSVLPPRERFCWSRPSRAATLLHGRLSLRGAARPPDARHAADPPAGARPAPPLGFVASDYSLAVWGLERFRPHMIRTGRLSLGQLFDEDMLGDDLEAWLAESWLLKRTFRNCAIIAGLIERRIPGKEKTGRQITVSADLIYDVLRQHEPDHILLQATRADAATGLLDVRRLGDMLSRIRGRIMHKALDRISPLAVPIMLEIGKERVKGDGRTPRRF